MARGNSLLTSASLLYLISPKSIFFVPDCRYYKSLIKHVYRLPPPLPPKFSLFTFLRNTSLLLTGLKLCWDLNLSFYSLPMNFNSPNPSFSLLSFVAGSGSHKIFVFNQLLFRLLLVTYFTYLVKCVLITIWLYTYSGRVFECRIRRCYVLFLERTQNFSFFFFTLVRRQ